MYIVNNYYAGHIWGEPRASRCIKGVKVIIVNASSKNETLGIIIIPGIISYNII